MRALIHDYAGHPFQVQLSRELARRGHFVTHAFAGGLLTPRGNLQRKADDPATLEIVEVPMNPNYRRDKYHFLRRRRMEAAYGRRLAALIKDKKPNVVLSANTPTEPQLNIAKACLQGGIPFIPWIQDFYSIAVDGYARKKIPGPGHLIGWWYCHLEKRALRSAAAVVAITEDFLPMLETFGVCREKIAVIPNWAPLEELPLKPRRNPWSTAQGLDEKFVFLYAGTLGMKHDPDVLRRLASDFQEDTEVRVVVISDGPGADYLTARKAAERLDNLILLPFQEFGHMPDVLGSGDVLVAILEADAAIYSAPSKVMTYLCSGRPTLGMIPGVNLSARTIAEAQAGVCIEPGNLEAFLTGARELRTNATLRSKYGSNGRRYAEERFNIDGIATRFEELLLKHTESDK